MADHDGQLHHYDGDTWTTPFKATLAPTDLTGISVADDGRDFAIGPQHVLSRDGEGSWSAALRGERAERGGVRAYARDRIASGPVLAGQGGVAVGTGGRSGARARLARSSSAAAARTARRSGPAMMGWVVHHPERGAHGAGGRHRAVATSPIRRLKVLGITRADPRPASCIAAGPVARRAPRPDTSPLDPRGNVLFKVLERHLDAFLQEREEAGAPLPGFVVDELRGYLRCGVLSEGCARFECEDCHRVRVTGLSCKGRGFCPRCCGRRMTERARHLVERVFPEGVPGRQWVLTLPFELRVWAASDHQLALDLGRLVSQAVEVDYRRQARRAGLRPLRGGSVTVMQRFGSDLRVNLHYHGLHLDGVYVESPSGKRRFFRPAAPRPADVAWVLRRVLRKAAPVLAQARARRVGEALEDEALGLAQTLSGAARSTGARTHRPEHAEAYESPDQVLLPTRRKARIDQWDLDAEVCVKAHERERLEPMARYLLRPPFALDHLKVLGDDLIAIELKRPWRDGTTHVTMDVRTFLGRLASLVPRPRANTTIYAGVLAANAKDRADIVPQPKHGRSRAEHASWAALMKHSFGLDVLSCRACSGRMRFVTVLLAPAQVRRLLAHLRCFGDPLPVSPARGPPHLHVQQLEFP